jgi:hypothetical protein
MNYGQDNSFYFANNEPERVLRTSKHVNSKLIVKRSLYRAEDLMTTEHKAANDKFIHRGELGHYQDQETKRTNITPSRMKKVFAEETEVGLQDNTSFRFKFTSSDKKVRMDMPSHKSTKLRKNNENDIKPIMINLNCSFVHSVDEKGFFQVANDNTCRPTLPIISSCSSDSSDGNMNSQLIRHFRSKAKIDIPLDKIDDEKFKRNEIKKIRPPYFRDYKTLCKRDIRRPTQSPLEYNLLHHSKRRKVSSHSVKRIYSSEIPFYTNTNEPVYFRVFNDNDIGIKGEWQTLLHELENDEDVLSEDELIYQASQHLLNELRVAIDQVKETDSVQNVEHLKLI